MRLHVILGARPQPRCSTGAPGAPTATARPRARSISCMTKSANGCSTGSIWSTGNFPTCSISARATAGLPAGSQRGRARGGSSWPSRQPAFSHRRAAQRVAADPELVPFREASFDLVVSNLVLHWTADLPGALVQLRRALRPDGLLLAAMLGGQTLIELRTALFEAELEQEGGVSPRVSPSIELGDAAALLKRAGYALPVADSETITVAYPDPLALMRDLRGMGETNALADRRRQFMRRATLARAALIYAERFAEPDGTIPATFEVLFLCGWAPHPSQPKPLPRGSATARLTDALRRQEMRGITLSRNAGEGYPALASRIFQPFFGPSSRAAPRLWIWPTMRFAAMCSSNGSPSSTRTNSSYTSMRPVIVCISADTRKLSVYPSQL